MDISSALSFWQGRRPKKATKFGIIIIIPRIHYKGNIESAKMAKYGNN